MSDTVVYVFWIVLGTIGGVGILGNIVSFLVFCMQQNKLSVTYWLMALSVVDFASLAFSPMTAVSWSCTFKDYNYDICTSQQEQLLNIGNTVQDMLYTIHLFLLIGMSADRYITIAQPKTSRGWANKNQALIAIISLAIASIVMHLPGYAIGIPRPGIPNNVFGVTNNSGEYTNGHRDVTGFHPNGHDDPTMSTHDPTKTPVAFDTVREETFVELQSEHPTSSEQDEFISPGDYASGYGSGYDYQYPTYDPTATVSDTLDGVSLLTGDAQDDSSGDITFDIPTSLNRVVRNVQPTEERMTIQSDTEVSIQQHAAYRWGYVFGVRLIVLEVLPIMILSVFLCVLINATARSTRSLARKRATKGKYIANLSGTSMVTGVGTFCLLCAVPMAIYELLFSWMGLPMTLYVSRIAYLTHAVIWFLLVSINLTIYLVTDKQFRKDFCKFFSCKCC